MAYTPIVQHHQPFLHQSTIIPHIGQTTIYSRPSKSYIPGPFKGGFKPRGSSRIGQGNGDPTRPVISWKPPDPARPDPTRHIAKPSWPVKGPAIFAVMRCCAKAVPCTSHPDNIIYRSCKIIKSTFCLYLSVPRHLGHAVGI